jgi:hypothetical protein
MDDEIPTTSELQVASGVLLERRLRDEESVGSAL